MAESEMASASAALLLLRVNEEMAAMELDAPIKTPHSPRYRDVDDRAKMFVRYAMQMPLKDVRLAFSLIKKTS